MHGCSVAATCKASLLFSSHLPCITQTVIFAKQSDFTCILIVRLGSKLYGFIATLNYLNRSRCSASGDAFGGAARKSLKYRRASDFCTSLQYGEWNIKASADCRLKDLVASIKHTSKQLLNRRNYNHMACIPIYFLVKSRNIKVTIFSLVDTDTCTKSCSPRCVGIGFMTETSVAGVKRTSIALNRKLSVQCRVFTG